MQNLCETPELFIFKRVRRLYADLELSSAAWTGGSAKDLCNQTLQRHHSNWLYSKQFNRELYKGSNWSTYSIKLLEFVHK